MDNVNVPCLPFPPPRGGNASVLSTFGVETSLDDPAEAVSLTSSPFATIWPSTTTTYQPHPHPHPKPAPLTKEPALGRRNRQYPALMKHAIQLLALHTVLPRLEEEVRDVVVAGLGVPAARCGDGVHAFEEDEELLGGGVVVDVGEAEDAVFGWAGAAEGEGEHAGTHL
jgi:hypothetical protein